MLGMVSNLGSVNISIMAFIYNGAILDLGEVVPGKRSAQGALGT